MFCRMHYFFFILSFFTHGIDLESDFPTAVRAVLKMSRSLREDMQSHILMTTKDFVVKFSTVVEKNKLPVPQFRDSHCLANGADCGANNDGCCQGNICALTSFFPFSFNCVDCEQCPGTLSAFDCPDPSDPICDTSSGTVTVKPTPSFPTRFPSQPPVGDTCLGYQELCGTGVECCEEEGLTCYNDIIDQIFFGQRCLPCSECISVINGPALGTDACPTICEDDVTTTIRPTAVDPTLTPSSPPTTDSPSIFPTTDEPSISPTTDAPSINPTTDDPSVSPSFNPTSEEPSISPTSDQPSLSPTSEEPSTSPSSPPSSTEPSLSPSSEAPSLSPTVEEPSVSPTVEEPSVSPTSEEPSVSPTVKPSVAPILGTEAPTFSQPTASPSTSEPSLSPSSEEPSLAPSSEEPSLSPSFTQPSLFPSSDEPSLHPSSDEPSLSPSSDEPSLSPSSEEPSIAPSSDQPSQQPSLSPSTDEPSISPSTDQPSISPTTDSPSTFPTFTLPSVAPSSDEPSMSPSDTPSFTQPSLLPSSDEPSISPSSDQPTFFPSTIPTTAFPSISPTAFPSNSPIPPPSSSPTSPAPTEKATLKPTLLCSPGNYTEIGSDSLQMDLDESGLDGDVLTLVLNWPNWMNVTSVSFVGSSQDLAYLPGESDGVWVKSDQNICQGRLTAILSFNEAYQNNILKWTITSDDAGAYLTNTIRLGLIEDIYARGNSYERTYEYDIRWQLAMAKNVGVDFDLVDMYAAEYYAQGNPLCLQVPQNDQVAFTLEHSNVVSQSEWEQIRDTWVELVENEVANTIKLGTVTFGEWTTVGGTEVDQHLEDFLNKDVYASQFQALQYETASIAATKQALELAIDMIDEFNIDESGQSQNKIILVTYQPPVTFDDPFTSSDDNEDMDVCSVLPLMQEKDATLKVIALTDRTPGGWSNEALESIFGCLGAQIMPQPDLDSLLTTLADPSIISSYACNTDGALVNPSLWAEPMAIETTYVGDNGVLTWSGSDGQGSIYWDNILGWTIDGYGDQVVSFGVTGSTPSNTVTEVTSWFIVPTSTGVPEALEYFRVGAVGYSVCKVGDQAGFEDPTSVESTAAGVPSEYYFRIGTVTAINVDDISLGCSATTVQYDDGASFNYCYNEVRCSDWVNRCEVDCTLCVAYDSSGSADNLVSEAYWTILPFDQLGTCSFGASTGTCGTEVGPTFAATWYQCVGNPRTAEPVVPARRRILEVDNIPALKQEERRLLTGNEPCHGVWGLWSECSTTCGKGFETRTYTYIKDGNCPWDDGAKDVRSCELYPCPRLQDLITHEAHFVPDLEARRSTMYIHFSTHMNAPWQFEQHDLAITDQDGAVDSDSVMVSKVYENCNGMDTCVQEWQLDYYTVGICDNDGMHKLELTPSLVDGTTVDTAIQVVLSLVSHGCGIIEGAGLDGGYTARPGHHEEDASESHTMTVEMVVRRPESSTDMNLQVAELLTIVSSNIGGAEVLEISRSFKIPIRLKIDHAEATSEFLFDFFEYLPVSIGSVLGIHESAVRDFQVGSSLASTDMTASFTIYVPHAEMASEIYLLLDKSPDAFTSALTTDLQTQAEWLDEEVILEDISQMSVSVTLQAEASSEIDLNALTIKLESLGYQVVTHDDFGRKTNVIPIDSQTQTVQITKSETSSVSETLVWQIMFVLICSLLLLILLAVCYKRNQDKKEQKAKKATKLYEYQTQKDLDFRKMQLEDEKMDQEGDATHVAPQRKTIE